MSTRDSPGGKDGRSVRLTTYHPCSAERQEIRGLNLPGPPWAISTECCGRDLYLYLLLIITGGRDSSVGIATRYGLDGPGWNPGGGEIFRTRPDRPWSHPASYTMGIGFFPGVNRPGRGVDHPHPSSGEVKGRVELYICVPSGSSWPVLG